MLNKRQIHSPALSLLKNSTFDLARGAANPPTLHPCRFDRMCPGTSIRPWLADRTKVVTMGAPLKLIGLQTLFLSTFSRSSSGFSVFRSWKSPSASSPTEHRAAALNCSSLKSRLIGLAALACRRLNFCGDEG